MKVFEAITVGISGLAVGLFVGMCAPEGKKPKFCREVISNIGERLKKAEEKGKERAEEREPTIVNA